LRAKRSNPANNASKAIQSLLTHRHREQREAIQSLLTHRHREQREAILSLLTHRHCEQREAIHKKTQHIAHVISSNAMQFRK